MEDDDFEVVGRVGHPVVRRARLIDLLVLGAHLVDELAGAIHSTTTAAFNLAAMHANFVSEQGIFRQEAAIEIETLTGEADG